MCDVNESASTSFISLSSSEESLNDENCDICDNVEFFYTPHFSNFRLTFQPETIRVYLRIKNGYDLKDLYEIEGNTLVSKVPPGSNFLRNIKEGDSLKKIHAFTKIFEPQTTQRDIFNDVVKPKIFDFINGQNSTLLTYGASGSGKTFTVIGTDEEPGIVPRSLEYLFRTLPQLMSDPAAKPSPAGNVTLLSDSDCKKEKLLCRNLLNSSSAVGDRMQHVRIYKAMQQRLSSEPVAFLEDCNDLSIGVWISFAEIYNEQIYDLLRANPSKKEQRPRLRLGMSKGQVYIKNLTCVNVRSGEEAYQILQYGLNNLNYAPTRVNEHSSRSHSIFTIKLVQVSKSDGGCFVSSFNFCDLAGSERSKKTLNVGDRLRESNNINTSLLVLGRCISAVRNAQKAHDNKLVPFRESKLTQLFQKALSGGEDIAMIVTINPSREMFDESQHVLNFSAVASEISIETATKQKETVRDVLKNKTCTEEDFEYTSEELQNMILLLRDELEIQRNEYETNLKIEREYLRKGYEEIYQDHENYVQERIKFAEERVRRQYEDEIEAYKDKIKELENRSEVIELSSDEESEAKETRRRVTNLRRTLDEGFGRYRAAEEKCRQLEIENIQLKERIFELENELEAFRQHHASVISEEIEGSETYGENGVAFNLWDD
ncbi:subito [Tribolium castaneum]|uniref:Kinesin-like protein n=1 Tax=Tribolium castaneum TaxID=7070 RepID=A0A139WGR9_TRICA|nr:subito [Tribolium castaneum]